jgi:hypothetical protein
LLRAARVLGIDRLTAEVVTAMDQAGVPNILLKGPSIARWLYPSGGRTYGDTDLLVPPSRFGEAGGVLAALGFRERTEGFHPFERDLDAAAKAFVRRTTSGAAGGGAVDLHRSLPRLPVPDQLVWDTLSAQTDTLVVGGVEARVLNRAGLALHVVVHAVQHGFRSHTGEDLRRAVEASSIDEWREAAGLAGRLGIEGVLGFGLRRHPKGVEVADRLGLPQLSLGDSPFFWSCAGAPRGAHSLVLAWSAPTLVEKARRGRWALVPSPAKIRYQSGLPDARGRSLLVAYVRHWRGVATSLGPAVRFSLGRYRRRREARDG